MGQVVAPLKRAFCLLCGDAQHTETQRQAEAWARGHLHECRVNLYRQPRHEWRWPLGNGQDIVLTAFVRTVKAGESVYFWPDHGGGFPQMTTAITDLEHRHQATHTLRVPSIGSIWSVEPERDQ